MSDSLTEITRDILRFRNERDWAQFHTPRNLAAALAIEVAELQEEMLWKSDQDVDHFLHRPDARKRVANEIGDVLIYALLLAHACEIEPLTAVREKIALNAAKYPVEKARGKSTKYTDL